MSQGVILYMRCRSSVAAAMAKTKHIEIHMICMVLLQFFFFTAPWSGQKFSNARNQAFIFSTFLIFAVIAAAYAPLSHRKYGFIA